MKILVTGAAGMVARAAAAHCRSLGDEVVAATRQQLDIGDRDAVFSFLGENLPDAVLNCAAYTNVDGAESEPEAAERANVSGVENLAAACKTFDCAFVTISTDYVFDGRKPDFYTQRDTPEPLGIYGRTKLGGERAARDTYARSIIVRSGWIYGAGGTNFLSVVAKMLAAGKPLSAIADACGTPTFAGDLAARLRELAVADLPAIYHVTNAGPGASYAEFAEAVCDLAGIDRSLVSRVSKATLDRPAARPESSKLACLFSERIGLKPMREWKTALGEFVSPQIGSN